MQIVKNILVGLLLITSNTFASNTLNSTHAFFNTSNAYSIEDIAVNDVLVIPKGIGGHTSGQMLNRINSDVYGENPTTTIVLAGTNDFLNPGKLTSYDDFEDNLRAIVSGILNDGGNLLLMSIPPVIESVFLGRQSNPELWEPEGPNARVIEANLRLNAVAQEYGVFVVDTYNLFANNSNLISNDGLHQNDAGSQAMANLLRDAFVETGFSTSRIVCFGDSITNRYPPFLEETLLNNPIGPVIGFEPDPNKAYYINSPVHNVRLASNGEDEDAYAANGTETGDDVKWKFVAHESGSWHIERAEGGSAPRLRSDGTEDADMQANTSNGTNTYFNITTGDSAGTYFFTLPNGAEGFNRLQINNELQVKMVSDENAGTWESFMISDAGRIGDTVHLEAEDYDSMVGIQTQASSEGTDNVGWIENADWIAFENVDLSDIEQISVRAASETGGGDIEVRLGSATGQLLTTVTITDTGNDQVYETFNASLNGTNGIADVYFVFTGGSGYLFNINYFYFSEQTTLSVLTNALGVTKAIAFPNPANASVTIENSANAVVTIYNSKGNNLLSRTISSESEILNIDNLKVGVYYLELDNEGKKATLKLIKR